MSASLMAVKAAERYKAIFYPKAAIKAVRKTRDTIEAVKSGKVELVAVYVKENTSEVIL